MAVAPHLRSVGRMTSRTLLGLAALALVGCTMGEDDEGGGGVGGKGDGNGECLDPQYGDGVCHADLACGIPDIDCFDTFATDADAAAWLTSQRSSTTLAETDPRFVRARALTDRAWDTYRAVYHLGKLADARLSVVAVDDPTLNAYVTGSPDTGHAVLSVQYHSAILAPEISDDELLGVVFHELAHAVKLHILPEVYDKTQRFYVADGAEPIGSLQADDARVRTHVGEWQNLAWVAGPYAKAELRDLPFGGDFDVVFSTALQAQPNICVAQVTAYNTLRTEIQGSSTGVIDEDLVISAATSTRIRTTLDALASCMRQQGSKPSIRQLFANDPEWTSWLQSVVAANEQWLLDDDDALIAAMILIDDRRTQMRAMKQGFERDLGASWASARFFSTEEEADDVSVRLGKAHKLAAPGVSMLMRRVMGSGAAACDQAIAAQRAPYGVRLDDPHHGDCWRVAHAQQLASEADTSSARRVSAPVAREPWTPTRRPTGEPMY